MVLFMTQENSIIADLKRGKRPEKVSQLLFPMSMINRLITYQFDKLTPGMYIHVKSLLAAYIQKECKKYLFSVWLFSTVKI